MRMAQVKAKTAMHTPSVVTSQDATRFENKGFSNKECCDTWPGKSSRKNGQEIEDYPAESGCRSVHGQSIRCLMFIEAQGPPGTIKLEEPAGRLSSLSKKACIPLAAEKGSQLS